MQKIITLIIAALIIYAVIDAKNQVKDTLPTNPNHKVENAQTDTSYPELDKASTSDNKTPQNLEGSFLEKSMSKVLINVIKSPEGRAFLEKIVKPANTPIAGEYSIKVNDHNLIRDLLQIQVISEGEGPAVSCGHIVNVNYSIVNSDNVQIEAGTKNFQLGSTKVIPALTNMIVGMKVGEIRKAIVHKNYAYNAINYSGKAPSDPTEFYTINATLIEVIPNNFVGNEVKIFDDEIAYSVPYLCGDLTTFNAKISKFDGTILFDSTLHHKPITMSLGDQSYPMIFSHALVNKVPVGNRTVICKGRNLRSLLSKDMSKIFPDKFQQPNLNEYFIIEFSDFKRAGQ